MKISNSERNLLDGLSLYLASRHTSLRSALRLRAPLSLEDAEDLRIHYSNYFVSLISAVDLITEDASFDGEKLKQALHLEFSKIGHQSHDSNYLYVRELRNSIVHRGLDVAAAAQFAGDFPLLVAPNPVFNWRGTQKYPAFSFYLIAVIIGCEAVVGPMIEAHLDVCRILEKEPDGEAWTAEALAHTRSSAIIPDRIKRRGAESLAELDWGKMHRDRIAKLRALLKPFAFDNLGAFDRKGVA